MLPTLPTATVNRQRKLTDDGSLNPDGSRNNHSHYDKSQTTHTTVSHVNEPDDDVQFITKTLESHKRKSASQLEDESTLYVSH